MTDDLISRADAIDVLIETIAPPSITLDTLVMRIDAIPSAQPKIIRCKECRWATETRFKSIEGDVIYLKTCPSRTEVIDDDDFCSYGEREGE